MKIILVDIQSKKTLIINKVLVKVLNLRLGFLSRILKDNGHEVEFIKLNFKQLSFICCRLRIKKKSYNKKIFFIVCAGCELLFNCAAISFK